MAIKKKIIKNTTPWIVTKTVTEIDPKNIPTGTYFKGIMRGKMTEGLVYNDPRNKYIYLCQNMHDVSICKNKLGFRYAIKIYYDNISYINNFKFSPKSANFKIPVLPPQICGYYPEIRKGYVKVGCKTIKNTEVRELLKHLKD